MNRLICCLLLVVLPFLMPDLTSAKLIGLSMKGFKTEQIGTWHNQSSDLAVDGDLESYIVACEPCHLKKVEKDVSSWWKVYLDKVYLVHEVFVSKTPNEFGKFAKDIRVTMTDNNNKTELCKDHRGIETNSWMVIPCIKPLYALEVTITRLEGSRLRPGLMSFAEMGLSVESSFPVMKIDSLLITAAVSVLTGIRFLWTLDC